MKRSKLLSGLATAAAAALLLAGCAQSDRPASVGARTRHEAANTAPVGTESTWRSSGETRVVAPAPEKPAATPAAKPAPAPKAAPARSGMNWASRAYPTGDQRTSAVLVEKGMPYEVMMNETFESIVRVTNLTNETLQDVVVTDTPGANLRMIESNPAGSATAGGVSWNLGNLAAGETREIKVRATATAEGTVGNCVNVAYNSLLCIQTPVVSPKLQLVKTGPAQVLKCDPINYEFVVTNTGTGTVRNVTITDPLPAGLSGDGGARSLTFNAGDLPAGASKSFRATVTANAAGSFDNKATASAAGGMTAESAMVRTTVVQPTLTITDECTGRAFIGRPIEHTIRVCNTGSGACNNTTTTFNLPAGTTFVSATDGGRFANGVVTWNTGTINPRDCKEYKVTMTPNGAGTFKGTARAQCVCADAVTAECTTEITGIPAILLECVDNPDPVAVGTDTTYTITVTNQGSATGTGIKIRCELESQSYVSSSGSTQGTNRGNVVEFAPLPSLAPGERATFRVVVKATAAGDVRFKVSMTSDQFTRPVEETESTNQYQ